MPSFPDEVLADGPWLYWRMTSPVALPHTGSFVTIADASGNARNGELFDAVYDWASVATLLADSTTTDKALQWPSAAAASRSRIKHSTSHTTTTWTAEAIIKTSATSPSAMPVVTRRGGTTSASHFSVGLLNGLPYLYVATSADNTVQGSTAINDGKIHHLAAAFDGSIARMYVDGVQVATLTVTGYVGTANTSLMVGSDDFGRGPFRGIIGEAAYFTKALSAERIAAHATAVNYVPPAAAQQLTATLGATSGMTARVRTPFRLAAALSTSAHLTWRFDDESYPLAASLSATSTMAARANVRSRLRAGLSASADLAALLRKRTPLGATLSSRAGLTARARVRLNVDILGVDLDLAVDVDDAALSVAQIDVAPIDLSLDVTTGLRRGRRNPYKVERWHFQNPVTGEDWSHPINPNAMTSPHRPREVVTTAGAGPHGSFEGGLLTRVPPPQPKQWEFSGVIRTESHYQDLDRWAHMETPIYVTDHLDRTWEVVIETFAPEDRQPTYRVPWRYRYTMRCLLMRRMR